MREKKWKRKKERKRRQENHGVELIKIIAIFVIILSHATDTIGNPDIPHNLINNSNEIFFNFCNATDDLKLIAVKLMKVLPFFGNYVFMIASAWYLAKSNKLKLNKIVNMILDVFIISISILGCTLLLKIHIPAKEIVKSFFPTLLSNNWFITCYILMYLLHPFLNICINKLKEQHFRYLCIGLIGVIILNTFKRCVIF